MIIRPATRPQTALRAVGKQAAPLLSRSQRRCKHSPAEWADRQRQERFTQRGVPGFLSAKTYQETYAKYTKHLCDKLNEYTQGTADESHSAHDLHAICSHKPERAALYNHAAMAIHTHFFWEALTDSEDPHDRKAGNYTARSIEMDFESLDHLRTEFLEVADAMFGNGFVWLMKPKTPGGLKILATYNAGSPYSVAAPRRDDRDMATFNGRQVGTDLLSAGMNVDSLGPGGGRYAGSFGNFSSARANLFVGALDAEPILCVNVWQHQWLPDYGMFGKREYLTAWWDSIDWKMVESRHNHVEWEQDRRVNRSRGRQQYTGLTAAVQGGL
ncbi:hypothetical protein PV11_09399 [Exophiala sideris]|uniref:Manganese/iron superoxide dismutase C-terminal domain-containing protein n=1 Tax=Exophiala sideris TaxID=1016849 RepID=A0A0D1WRA3_9EURO|nr:hypothetical protein PV11_09399 [Exophiala sideris]